MSTQISGTRNVDSRWLFLAAAVASMMLVGLYQYSWFLFVQPLQTELVASASVIQLTFVVSTWAMTLIQPIAGVLADRKGPRTMNVLGALLVGAGWIACSRVPTPETLYVAYGVGGMGSGIIYATSIGTANKWFPDRRGLATGLASFGYGFGATVFNPVISAIIDVSSFHAAFLQIGAIMLIVLLVTGLIISYPPLEQKPSSQGIKAAVTETRQYNIKDMLLTHQWWQIYLAFILTANLGLMVTPQFKPLGSSFNLDAAIIVLASSTWSFTNGVGRILGGIVSDRLGRERTMVLYFLAQAGLTLGLNVAGFNPILFVTIVTLLGLVWGPIFTFFPSIIADYYGRKNSTANYGLTYTAKGWGASLGDFALAILVTVYGGYSMPLIVSAAFSLTSAALVAPIILKKPKEKT